MRHRFDNRIVHADIEIEYDRIYVADETTAARVLSHDSNRYSSYKWDVMRPKNFSWTSTG